MEILLVLLVLAVPVAVVLLLVVALLKAEVREAAAASIGQLSRTLVGRLVLLACTMLVLLVPLQLVEGLRSERGYRLDQVRHELAEQWGGTQTVVGPLLHVPVLERYEERQEKVTEDGEVRVWTRPVVIQRDYLLLPDAVTASGEISPRSLHRGLYDVMVYDADVGLQATFSRPHIPARDGHTMEILWDEAQLVVELSDLTAVSGVGAMTWEGRDLHAEAGALQRVAGHNGISAPITTFEGDHAQAQVRLSLRGMGGLYLGALGEDNAVALSGTWDAPSFTGFTLPAERVVARDTFSANWAVPGVARPVPQLSLVQDTWPLDPLRAHTVGVELVEPASAYASVERALTYGLLVIVLCLLTFLFLEHGLGLSLHPVQWLVNGLGLVVFYVILLATSEHAGLLAGYGIASAVTVTLMSAYILVGSRSVGAAAGVGSALSLLYGCLYVMLRSEDHALLMGAGLVVVALAGTMWVTRQAGRTVPGASPE